MRIFQRSPGVRQAIRIVTVLLPMVICAGHLFGKTNNSARFSSDSVAVASQIPLAVSITNSQATTCWGAANGSATAQATGGVAPYSYAWSSGATTPTAANLTFGTHYVTVTDAIGDSAFAYTVIGYSPTIQLTFSSTNPLNCLYTSTTVTASASGGVPGYTYVWSTGETGPSAYINGPGAYSVTVTDAVGCAHQTKLKFQPNITPPNAVATPTATIPCNSTVVTLNGNGSSTGQPFTYLWTTTNGNIVSGATTLTPMVNAPGNYTLLVTNTANGCTATASTTVTAQTGITTAPSVSGAITCLAPTATICANASAPNATFLWAGPGVTTPNLACLTVSTIGQYTVTVTNPNTGCTATGVVVVKSNLTPPNATATGGVLLCNPPTVQIQGNSTTPNVGYTWSGPNGFSSTLKNPTVAVAGWYELTVYNPANGCTATAATEVTANIAPPTVSAGTGGMLTCVQNQVPLLAMSAAPGSSYAWSGPNGFTAAQQNAVAGQPGVYTVTVTVNTNGCSATATASVSQNTSLPTATVANQVLSCTAPSTTLCATSNVQPGATFAWSGPNAFSSMLPCAEVNVSGSYTVTVTDAANGCTASATGQVTQNSTPPTAAIATPGMLDCYTNIVQLDASASSQGPGISYQWMAAAGGNIVSGDTTLLPTVDAAGSYSLVVTNLTNGCTSTSAVAVVQIQPLTASIIAYTPVSCFGGANGTATVAGSGGTGLYTVAWSNGDTTASIMNLSSGAYTVTVTDVNGCTATTGATIIGPTALTINIMATNETAVGAADGTATAVPGGGTGPYAYAWSNGDTTSTITGLAPGMYFLTLTDLNGCTSIQSITIKEFACDLAVTSTVQAATCAGQVSGAAALAVLGGTAPYAYNWSNGASTAAVTNLAAGTYSITIGDAQGCVLQQAVTIGEPAPLTTSVVQVQNVSCPEDENGAAEISIAGGMAPYSVLWSSEMGMAQGLGAGTYVAVVTDANGCTAEQSVDILAVDTVPPVLTCPPGQTVCGGTALQYPPPVATDNCALTSPVEQLLGPPGGTVLALGTHDLLFAVEDGAGNAATCQFTVTVTEPPQILTVTVTHATGTSANGSIEITTSAMDLTFTWTQNGQVVSSEQNPTGLTAGLYTVTATDPQGCTVSLDSIEVHSTVGSGMPGNTGDVRLWPNPARETIQLQWPGRELTGARLFSPRGQLLRQFAARELLEPLAISHLPAGMYTLLLMDRTGSTVSVRFVKYL